VIPQFASIFLTFKIKQKIFCWILIANNIYANLEAKNLDVKMCGISVIFFLYFVRNQSGYGWSVCAEPHFPISRLSRFHTESLIMTPFVIACAKRSIKGLLSCSHTLFKKVLYISPCSRFVLILCRT